MAPTVVLDPSHQHRRLLGAQAKQLRPGVAWMLDLYGRISGCTGPRGTPPCSWPVWSLLHAPGV